MKKYSHFLVALLVVLLDQITKYLARSYLSTSKPMKIFPFLYLVNWENEGAAFGMFKSFGNAAFIVISLAAIVFVCYLLIKSREDRLGLSFVLGGAAGNLIDRILFGSVTDFVQVDLGFWPLDPWPAFNVADSALTVGLTMMLLNAFFQHKEGKA